MSVLTPTNISFILQGLWLTLYISFISIVLSTIIGTILAVMRNGKNPVLRLISSIYIEFVRNVPNLLWIFIIFLVFQMKSTPAGITAFTVFTSAALAEIIRGGLNGVDHGQTEAAYALGYTKNKTFFRIIFPQAMTVFLPSYCGQAVDLIKATAVVGYIAVNDLTKMGDIIRSNTYEAFFPLIATAIIYFLLTWILSLLLGLVKKRFEPKRRKKEDILKGVKTV